MLPYVQETLRVGGDFYYATDTGTTGTLALTVQRQYFVPIKIDTVCSILKLGVEATATAATAIGRIGIYKDAGLPYARPGELLAAGAANIDLSAAAFVEATFTGGARITKPGVYWLALVNQTAAATVRTSAGVRQGQVHIPASTVKPTAQGVGCGYYKASVSGAIADVATTDSLVAITQVPWFYFQVD